MRVKVFFSLRCPMESICPPRPGTTDVNAMVPLIIPGQSLHIDPKYSPESMIIYAKKEKRLRERMEEDRELRQDMAVWTVEQCAAYFQDSNPELATLILEHVGLVSLLGNSESTEFSLFLLGFCRIYSGVLW